MAEGQPLLPSKSIVQTRIARFEQLRRHVSESVPRDDANDASARSVPPRISQAPPSERTALLESSNAVPPGQKQERNLAANLVTPAADLGGSFFEFADTSTNDFFPRLKAAAHERGMMDVLDFWTHGTECRVVATLLIQHKLEARDRVFQVCLHPDRPEILLINKAGARHTPGIAANPNVSRSSKPLSKMMGLPGAPVDIIHMEKAQRLVSVQMGCSDQPFVFILPDEKTANDFASMIDLLDSVRARKPKEGGHVRKFLRHTLCAVFPQKKPEQSLLRGQSSQTAVEQRTKPSGRLLCMATRLGMEGSYLKCLKGQMKGELMTSNTTAMNIVSVTISLDEVNRRLRYTGPGVMVTPEIDPRSPLLTSATQLSDFIRDRTLPTKYSNIDRIRNFCFAPNEDKTWLLLIFESKGELQDFSDVYHLLQTFIEIDQFDNRSKLNQTRSMI